MSRATILLSLVAFALPVFAGNGVRLSTGVSGVVEDVFVQPGQRVKKGDKLLQLDSVRQQARLMEAEAALARLKPESEEADRELKRAEDLYARGVSATTEFDAAKVRHARASAGVREAEAQRLIAQKNLDDTTLRAPFDGIVRQREAEPGMVVAVECNPPTLIVLEKAR